MGTPSFALHAALAVLAVLTNVHPGIAAEMTESVLVRLGTPDCTAEAPHSDLETACLAETIADAVDQVADALEGTPWELVGTYETIPYVALRVSPEARTRLESLDIVTRIQPDSTRRLLSLGSPMLTESTPIVQAPRAWDLGYDGSGWTVAIVDSGVEADHNFLSPRVVHEACFTDGACPNGTSRQTGPGAARPCSPSSHPTCQHGTHVAGIAAGRSPKINGVAPRASIIGIQVFQRTQCERDQTPPCYGATDSSILGALEHVYQLRNEHRIAAVNLSLGGGRWFSEEQCDSDLRPYKEVVDRLRSVGIATIAASGNGDPLTGNGYPDSLAGPACLSTTVSVGATQKDDWPASFSNVAPFLDLLAPGTGDFSTRSILSSIPGITRLGYQQGTSQAAPHVTGAFAILTQALGEPDVARVLATLKSTGRSIRDGSIYTPRIRIADALETLLEDPEGTRESGIQITPNGAQVLVSKDLADLRWSITLNREDGTVTGNVFSEEGDPKFLWCEEIGRSESAVSEDMDISYECRSANSCLGVTCEGTEWISIEGSSSLPASFFEPRSRSGGSRPASSGTTASETGGTAQAPRSSGLEITPDQKRTLVNKDLGNLRWAITRNESDGTVTGNVYQLSTGKPLFLWCDPMRTEPSPVPGDTLTFYSCFAADPCAGECSPGDWRPLGERSLAESFFSR